ncbi:MAG: RNA polymerase sigma factor [Fidelibacterota bacterium]
MTDEQLVQRYQEGEEGAFDELVTRHYPDSFKFFFRMVGDRMEADDLCQETFIRVHRGLKSFRLESNFSTWLYRISINVANTFFRKRKLRRSLFRWADPDSFPSQGEGKNTLIPGLWTAIGKLPKKQREVVILRVFHELAFREVGGVLNMSENSAKVNFHHAVRNLRKHLGES